MAINTFNNMDNRNKVLAELASKARPWSPDGVSMDFSKVQDEITEEQQLEIEQMIKDFKAHQSKAHQPLE